MLRSIAVIFVLLSLTTFAGAQPAKKDLAVDTTYLRTLAETRSFQLGRPMRPLPTPDGKAILFLRSEPRAARLSLFEFDVAGGKTRELISPADLLKGAEEKLSPEEKAARERMRVSTAGFTSFQLSDDGSLILLSLSGRLYTVERETKKVRELPTGKGFLTDPKFAPDGKKVSYVRDHDIYVLDLGTLKEMRVTTGGTALVEHGVAEFVAQEEMARFTGYWWAPDSERIAYQVTDNKDVEIWYVADPTNPGSTPTPFYYPRPGKNNAQVKLGVIAIDIDKGGGKTRWIEWDRDKYPYLATVRWQKKAPLTLTVQSRDQREVAVLEADLKSGKTTTLLTEKSSTWVNLRQEVPHWLPSGDSFLWVSEKDDMPRLELRTAKGKIRRVLVGADVGYQSLIGIDKAGSEIAFTASKNPTESHVYRIALDGPFAEPEALTKEPGMHGAVFSRDHGVYVVTSRTMKMMPTSFVFRKDGKPAGELPSVAENPKRPPVVDLVVVGKFHAAVVMPQDYDVKKKYPVIVDVYGGPHHLQVQAAQSRWLLDQWYADQGFIVVAIDGRGTPGRGADWERAIYQKFGSVPLDDQVAGLKELGKKFPMMDLKRVGIDGWSFGGYMSALAVMRRPDVFHAGVAGAPVCDWEDYDTHYTERYLGIPPKDAAAYKEGNLLTYAQDLKRPLMVLHGTADDNVYFCHSLKLVRALFKSGKDFEMVPLSGLTHMVPDPQVAERLHGRIALFFQKHLGRPE